MTDHAPWRMGDVLISGMCYEDIQWLMDNFREYYDMLQYVEVQVFYMQIGLD